MFLRQISKLCLTKPPGSIDIGSQIPRSQIQLTLFTQQICGGSDPCGSRQMDRQGSSAWPAACGNRKGAEKTGIVILLSPPLYYTRFSRYSFWSFRFCPGLSGHFGFFPDLSCSVRVFLFSRLCPVISDFPGFPVFRFSGFYSAAFTSMMWGFAPSYQYKKPVRSTTSPIFSSFTAL